MARKKQRMLKTLALRPELPDEVEKQAVITACEAFIDNVLKPHLLPEVRPTKWNYVVDILGAWAAGRYRFVQRYRSGMERNLDEEFDAPFAASIAPDRTVSTSNGCSIRASGGDCMSGCRLPRRFESWKPMGFCVLSDPGARSRVGVVILIDIT
jgi:hypothetical protein